MPCYEPDYIHSKGDAILCSIFRKAENEGRLQEVIDSLDYELIGLSKEQVVAWWDGHKSLDAKKLKEKE
jgi:hypothetical protein